MEPAKLVNAIQQPPGNKVRLPRRPKTLDPDQLGFMPQAMVSWFDPYQLLQTAIRTVLSSVFGSYADKRDLMPALSAEQPIFDFSHQGDTEGDFWLDFVADTGDGFDSTYTVASLVAAPTLTLDGVKETLPRGKILVFGGDGVYPTASRDEYLNRLLGPFRAALPFTKDVSQAPNIFALPGNHDWYDGLTSFLRLFAQDRWIGGWKTRQKRSYFALKLPQGWWLWGTDIQLASDIDHPQRLFFEDLAKNRLAPGDQVILCTAEPTWSHEWQGHKDAFNTLAFFEEKVLRRYGHEPALVLSGDLHNYHRYFRNDRHLQRITAGGGGAFLHATHPLPLESSLLEGDAALTDPSDSDLDATAKEIIAGKLAKNHIDKDGRTLYTFGKAFPNHQESKSMSKGVRWAFFKKRSSPGPEPITQVVSRSWGLALFLAFYYLVGAWLVQSASGKEGLTLVQKMYGFLDQCSILDGWQGIQGTILAFFHTFQLLFYLTLSNPVLVVWSLILTGGLIGYCTAKHFKRIRIGLRHALEHLAAFALLFTFIIGFNHFLDAHTFIKLSVSHQLPGGGEVVPIWFALVFTLEMLVGGFLVAGYIFGNYLYRHDDIHVDHSFSAQGIEDWKNFLKLRIRPDGSLSVYPVGIRKICTKWKANYAGGPETPFILPQDIEIQSLAKLIEAPLDFDVNKGGWQGLGKGSHGV
jgi:Calcineurin-like phosphoesterase